MLIIDTLKAASFCSDW